MAAAQAPLAVNYFFLAAGLRLATVFFFAAGFLAAVLRVAAFLVVFAAARFTGFFLAAGFLAAGFFFAAGFFAFGFVAISFFSAVVRDSNHAHARTLTLLFGTRQAF